MRMKFYSIIYQYTKIHIGFIPHITQYVYECILIGILFKVPARFQLIYRVLTNIHCHRELDQSDALLSVKRGYAVAEETQKG